MGIMHRARTRHRIAVGLLGVYLCGVPLLGAIGVEAQDIPAGTIQQTDQIGVTLREADNGDREETTPTPAPAPMMEDEDERQGVPLWPRGVQQVQEQTY